MDNAEIQQLANVYADIVTHSRLGIVMAVRSYGACVAAGQRPSIPTTEKFYDAMKDALEDPYREVIRYMEPRDQIALEKAIAKRVYDIINDMLAGCGR